MRRFILLALVLAGLLLIIPLSLGAQSLETRVLTNVNLRAGPGTDYPLVTTLAAGDVFYVDGRSPETTLWIHGSTAYGQAGWVFSDYLEAGPDQLGSLPAVTIIHEVSAPADIPAEAPPAPQPDSGAVSGAPVEAAPVSAPPAAPAAVVSGVTGNARAIFLRGQQLGNQAGVFSKVGDSITDTAYFLAPIGWGAYNLQGYTDLQPVISYFSATPTRTGNSFSNASLAARSGWTAASVLDPNNADPTVCQPGESPLRCEYRVNRPALALIMLGTNDMGYMPPEVFRANLAAVVQTSIDQGVIPVLSTIPIRYGYEGMSQIFNGIIAETARYYDVPLWDFEAALRGLANNGLWDGVHPSSPPGNFPQDFAAASDFSSANLGFGFTVRNLTALQTLDAIWRGAMY